MAQQFELSSPPSDGVSRVLWLSDTSLVVSSWDGSVALHEVGAGSRRAAAYAHKGGVLDVAGAVGGSVCYSGGLDMAVLRHDFAAGSTDVLGSHAAAVRCVEHCGARGLVLSGSWDKSVRAWDARSSSSGSGSSSAASASAASAAAGRGCVAALALPDRCYALALVGDSTLVAGTAGRHVRLYDLRRLGPEVHEEEGGGGGGGGAAALAGQAREGSMKHQTRAIRGLPDGSGFVTGSIEGRVAVDFVDLAPAVQERKYAFKVRQRALLSAPRARPTPLLSHPRPRALPLPPPCFPWRSATAKNWPAARRRRFPSMPWPFTRSRAPLPLAAATAQCACGTTRRRSAWPRWRTLAAPAAPSPTPSPPWPSRPLARAWPLLPRTGGSRATPQRCPRARPRRPQTQSL